MVYIWVGDTDVVPVSYCSSLWLLFQTDTRCDNVLICDEFNLCFSSFISLFSPFFDVMLLWNHFRALTVPSLISSLASSLFYSPFPSILLLCERRSFLSLHNSLLFTHVDKVVSGLVAMWNRADRVHEDRAEERCSSLILSLTRHSPSNWFKLD